MNNDKLVDLRRQLETLLINSKEPNTVKKYIEGYKKWKQWASKFQEICIMPASPAHVALFIASLFQDGVPYSSIESAFYGISWCHKLCGDRNPTDSSMVKLALQAVKRKQSRAKCPKQPITVECLKTLCRQFGGQKTSLLNLRFVAMSLLAFYGFFRYDELSKIRTKNVSFAEDHLVIHVEKSKTDVFREGNKVFIAATKTEICPVEMLKRYFVEAKLNDDPNEFFIFRKISSRKKGQRLCATNTKLSYQRGLSILKQKLSEIGYDPKAFGLHSFRSGGATLAANSGVPDRIFKRHGRWRSETAKDMYVQDDLESLLMVTRKISF